MRPERFSELREQKKLTQSQLAEKLDMSVRAIAAWESGERKPPIDKLEWLADFYCVSTDYLLGRTDTPLFEHQQTDASVLFTTKKELPEQPSGEPTMRMNLGAIDDLPRDRKQLEQLVSSMIEKALEDHHTNQ